LGGKNSKEKVGFPSALACSSFWEMCIVLVDEKSKRSKRVKKGDTSTKCL
jgi:hypothetical protein